MISSPTKTGFESNSSGGMLPRSAPGRTENDCWVAADGGPRLEPPKPARIAALPVSCAGTVCTVGGYS